MPARPLAILVHTAWTNGPIRLLHSHGSKGAHWSTAGHWMAALQCTVFWQICWNPRANERQWILRHTQALTHVSPNSFSLSFLFKVPGGNDIVMMELFTRFSLIYVPFNSPVDSLWLRASSYEVVIVLLISLLLSCLMLCWINVERLLVHHFYMQWRYNYHH